MGENSEIEWTDHTFNPWVGCTKISPACDHCYAESWANRSGMVKWGQDRVRTSIHNWSLPLKWDREALAAGVRRRVFCASLADVFDNEVPQKWRSDLWVLIASTPNLDWLLLTKRIGNAAGMLPVMDSTQPGYLPWNERWPWRNVWIGATIANQEEANRDIPKLLQLPAFGRFLSVEPMLGAIDLYRGGFSFLQSLKSPSGLVYPSLDWVIAGGESGPGARPMNPAWVRALRDQCTAFGVPFLFKQWGEWLGGEMSGADDGQCVVRHQDGTQNAHGGKKDHWWQGECLGGSAIISTHVGKKTAGRLLDGMYWDQLPKFARAHG